MPTADDIGMKRTTPIIAPAVAVTVTVLLGTVAHAQAQGPAATIQATDALEFKPGTVTVSVGDTVRWENSSVLIHSVTDVPEKALDEKDVALPKGDKPFNSGLMDPSATYQHRFARPGTYKYFCIPHEATGMIGSVIVKPAK